jgi:hypothetical protein
MNSDCLEINGSTAVLDICLPFGISGYLKLIDLVFNGPATVQGVSFSKLEIHPVGSTTCDVDYDQPGGVFPIVPTTPCPNEMNISGKINFVGMMEPPMGSVDICISKNSIIPAWQGPPTTIFDVIECNDPITTTSAPCDGTFSSTFLTSENLFHVTPIKDDNDLNGVTTFDIILIQKHILGIESLFGSPYKLIAADVNRSNSVTTFDIVSIRKLILLQELDFPNNTSWRFVDASIPLSTGSFPMIIPEDVVIPLNANPATNVNFVGIKIGDVNQNASTCTGSPDITAVPSKKQSAVFFADKDFAKAGGTIRLKFNINNEIRIEGWQIGIRFDPVFLEYSGITSVNKKFNPDDLVGLTQVQDGKIRALWYAEDGKGINFNEEEAIFQLEFRALQDIPDVSQYFRFDDQVLRNLVYDEKGIEYALTLRPIETGSISAQSDRLPGNLSVKAIPNPFQNQVVFQLESGDDTEAHITVYDVEGRQVASWQGNLSNGMNQVSFDKTEAWGTGVFSYLVKTGPVKLSGTIVKL